jgi:hypothetical protein
VLRRKCIYKAPAVYIAPASVSFCMCLFGNSVFGFILHIPSTWPFIHSSNQFGIWYLGACAVRGLYHMAAGCCHVTGTWHLELGTRDAPGGEAATTTDDGHMGHGRPLKTVPPAVGIGTASPFDPLFLMPVAMSPPSRGFSRPSRRFSPQWAPQVLVFTGCWHWHSPSSWVLGDARFLVSRYFH